MFLFRFLGPGWLNGLSGWNTKQQHKSLSPITKRCTRLAAASDKAYQLLAHGRWFSTNTPASSITKTGRHDIAEILLKVALKYQKSNQIKSFPFSWLFYCLKYKSYFEQDTNKS